MAARIDTRTKQVAQIMANKNGQDANYPWEIEGGGFVPGWAMYVSEATKAIAQADLLAQIAKVK